jgi:D-glycero-D-manno-heptose 1,7-bisphosphate phosphatase
MRRYNEIRRCRVKTIFIDRDGVINKDPGGWTKYEYVTRIEDFHFLPGSIEALKKLKKKGIKVVVISNQAGISKAFFTQKELNIVTDHMIKEILKKGGEIDKVYYCTHKKDDNCHCRKPKTGLFDMAQKELGLELNGTYFVGDTVTDVMAGRLAGCRTITVLSGKATEDDIKGWDEKPDYIFKDLLGAVNWLVEKEERRARRAARRG